MRKLTGITWDHSRGCPPVIATAQRYMEMHPDIKIEWDVRSLKAFGDAPVDKLAEQYDLIILDHPWIGFIETHQIMLPLDEYIEKEFIQDQQQNSVGKSFESYYMNNHQYALPIDAACPIAFYSPDKLKAVNGTLPKTWGDIIEMAKRGEVICAGNGTSILMQFYMLCATKASEQMFNQDEIAPEPIMRESLLEIKELFSYLPKEIFNRNPIGIYEMLVAEEGKAYYCPCDFGYSNYSRRGYSRHKIIATDVVSYKGNMLKTVLGGAGIAISAKCREINDAIDYVKYTTSGEVQKTLYVENGGQPGHRKAWLDKEANRITADFFRNTLETIDNAYLRPRYNGYLYFQEKAGPMIREWLLTSSSIEILIKQLQDLYHKSLPGGC